MAILYPAKADIQTTIDSCSPGDIIYLPNETIDFPIIVNKNCMIYGQGSGLNRTKIDLTSVDQNIAVTIENCIASLSNVDIFNKNQTNYLALKIQSSNANVSECSMSAFIACRIENCISSTVEDCTLNDSKTGLEIINSYGLNLSENEIYKDELGILLSGSSSVIGDTTVAANLRTDRTHDISFETCNIFSCQNGIMILNVDNISFDNCKLYDCSGIGITQLPNSYSNKFRGEIFNIGLYGIKNSDPQEGLHIFNAMETWWGDSTGPSGLGKGRGVKISKNVDYSAWARSGTEPDLTYPGTRRWIWNMLGYPQVKVELTEEDVTDCINMAIDKYLYYLTPDLDYYYVDVGPGTHEYKLPSWLPKSSITEVIYQPSSDIFAQLSGSGESFFLTYYMQGSGGTFLSDFYAAISYKETMERTLGIAPSYEFLSRIVNGQVEEYLRIYPKPSGGMKLGIKYNRMISEGETDSATWIRKYALTWAKEKLGRVRSKYASVPGPTGEMQLDGSTLLSEAATEREALLTEIISLGEPLSFSTG